MRRVEGFARVFCAIGVSFLAASCSSKSSGSKDLNLTFLDYQTRQPISGVTVVVHNSDRVTYKPENVKTSGADGVVRFADLSQRRVTFTVIDKTDTNSYYLETNVDFPATSLIVQLRPVNGTAADCSQNVNFSISGIPPETESLSSTSPWWLADFGPYSSSVISDAGTYEASASVCQEDIQSDGKLSTLVLASDASGQLTRYGYSLDRSVSDGATYSIALDHNPQTISWSTGSTQSLEYLGVYAIRKGVFHLLNDIFSQFGASDSLGSSGSIQLAAEFPHDFAYLAGGTSNGNESRWVARQIEPIDLGTTIDIAFKTDSDISNFSYDAVGARYSWSAIGENDFTSIYLTSSTVITMPIVTFQSIDWNVMLPPNVTEWTIPDLPIEIDTRQMLANNQDASVELTDYSAANGYDDIIAAILTFSDSDNWTVQDSFTLLGTFNSVSMDLTAASAASRPMRRTKGTTPQPRANSALPRFVLPHAR